MFIHLFLGPGTGFQCRNGRLHSPPPMVRSATRILLQKRQKRENMRMLSVNWSEQAHVFFTLNENQRLFCNLTARFRYYPRSYSTASSIAVEYNACCVVFNRVVNRVRRVLRAPRYRTPLLNTHAEAGSTRRSTRHEKAHGTCTSKHAGARHRALTTERDENNSYARRR